MADKSINEQILDHLDGIDDLLDVCATNEYISRIGQLTQEIRQTIYNSLEEE